MSAGQPPAAAALPRPRRCPFCGSGDLITTGKDSPETTYWRCQACGEIWNPSRTRVAPRRPGFGGAPAWRAPRQA